MMWIVKLALRRTYTFVVMALMIGAVSLVSIDHMSTDIFPEVNIPVVSVVWQYTGMPADEIEQRIILVNERVLTTSVNDIEHIESQSLFGVGVIRIYFYPHAKIEAAVAQVTATSQAILKVMPPGINPPYIVQYSATSVPIVQIAVSSDTLTEQQIFDYASNFIIQRLGTVQGRACPNPGAASGRRSWSISIPTSFMPAACRRRMCKPPSTTRTSSCQRALPRSATPSITSNSTAAPT